MAHLERPSPPTWQQSTFCEAGACVEVAFSEGLVLVRDGSGHVLTLPYGAWQAFMGDMKSGIFTGVQAPTS
jgi:hypothetical protein